MTATVRTALAAVVLAVPVAVEAFWLHSGDGDQHVAGHLAFAASQLVGWALILTVVRPEHRGSGAGWRSRLVVAGVVLQVAFAAAYAVTTVVSAEPAEGTFVLFLLGFLLLAVGGVAWGVRLLRSGARTAGTGVLLVGVLGFLAMAVGVSPWHDLALIGSYAAWLAVGIGIDRRAAESGTAAAGACHDPHHAARPAADRS